MYLWRNGKRATLKTLFPYGYLGSSPSRYTTLKKQYARVGELVDPLVLEASDRKVVRVQVSPRVPQRLMMELVDIPDLKSGEGKTSCWFESS